MNKTEKGSLRCVPIPRNKDGLEIIGLLGPKVLEKLYCGTHNTKSRKQNKKHGCYCICGSFKNQLHYQTRC